MRMSKSANSWILTLSTEKIPNFAVDNDIEKGFTLLFPSDRIWQYSTYKGSEAVKFALWRGLLRFRLVRGFARALFVMGTKRLRLFCTIGITKN